MVSHPVFLLGPSFLLGGGGLQSGSLKTTDPVQLLTLSATVLK